MKYVLSEINESGSITKRVFDTYESMEAYAEKKGMTLTQGPSPEIIKEIADTLIMRILTSKIEDIPKALVKPVNIKEK